MLKDRDSSAIVAVTDIGEAKSFYQDRMGLTLEAEDAEAEVLNFRTGLTRLTVYRSDYAGTNKTNAVTWEMEWPGVHDLHLWSVAGDDASLTAHVAVIEVDRAETTSLAVVEMLEARFGIHHATIQTESKPCGDEESLHA